MSEGVIYPRLFRTFVGDIFTTNTFKGVSGTVTDKEGKITDIPDLTIGDYVIIGNDGWLVKYTKGSGDPDSPATGIVFQVIPHFTQMNLPKGATAPAYTLPDKQWAVKLQRIQ